MTDIRIVTANVDFALRPEKVREDLEFLVERADIITFQEAKRVDIDRLIKDPRWAVYQPMESDATKGSGVAWRIDKAERLGLGKRIGTKPFGRAMLTRYIVWVRLEIDEQVIMVASLHMPPKRFWNFLYGNMLKNVRTFVAFSANPLIIGGDWNKLIHKATDLRKLAHDFDGRFYGAGIDGFFIVPKRKFWVTESKRLRSTHSDHHPVQMKIRLRG